MNTDAHAVVDAVCATFHVQPSGLMGGSRSSRVTWPRLVAYYLLREHLGWTYADIGAVFGRDHATVCHGVQRVAARCRVARVDREIVEDAAAAMQQRRSEGEPEQASATARAGIQESIERIDALVADALARRAALVVALSAIDTTVIVRGAA